MKITTTSIDVPRATGPAIRCVVAAPAAAGARRPAVLFFSDIFQNTGPHVRLAQRLAGHGFVVIAPEMYGRFLPAGSALDFDRDRQRALDAAAQVSAADVDADRRALIDHARTRGDVDPARVLACGFCFGGHVAFRAALDPDVKATACCYATTVHSESLGASAHVDTLARAAEIRGALLLVWGRDDPHIPAAGRAKIHAALDAAAVRWEARLYDAEHAFMRDEGPRYDAAATDAAVHEIVRWFDRA